jgi:hypothetical protein
MDTKQLTPIEAWDEFYKNYTCKGNKPNEIVLAEYTRRERLIVKGVTKALGVKRIRRLLDKYAPGQYDFHEGNPYFTIKKS